MTFGVGVINVTPSNRSLTLLSSSPQPVPLRRVPLLTGKNEWRHPVAVWLNFMRGRSGHGGRYTHLPVTPQLAERRRGGRGGIHDGGLADKNYPFKVEKRYKSVVKVAPQKRATYYHHHPRLLICLKRPTIIIIDKVTEGTARNFREIKLLLPY